jgi:hypothetical protein
MTLLMHRTTPKEEHLLASLKTAIAAFDISLVKEIEAIVADELDHRRDEAWAEAHNERLEG